MSNWLRGGLTSITGQLATFTQDILTEGTEEVEDYASQLKISNKKVQELEAVLATLQHEISQLKHANDELQLQSEALQLQLQQAHDHYRQQISDKDEEIRTLRQTVEHLTSKGTEGTPVPVNDWTLNTLSLDASHFDFASEEQPFSEIQLHDEPTRKVLPNKSLQSAKVSADDLLEQIRLLKEEKQEVEKELESLEENRQNELLAMQSSYDKRLQALSQCSESKLEKQRQEYEEKLQELRRKLCEATNTSKESSNGASDGWDNCGDLTEEDPVVSSFNDNMTLLAFPAESKSEDATEHELHSSVQRVEELERAVQELQDTCHQWEMKCRAFGEDLEKTQGQNTQLSNEIAAADSARDKLLKHPLMLLYNSLEEDSLKKAFLETFSLCYQEGDAAATEDLLQRCRQFLCSETTDTASQHGEPAPEARDNLVSNSTQTADDDEQHEEQTQQRPPSSATTLSSSLRHSSSQPDQLEEHLHQLAEQVERYQKEVEHFTALQQHLPSQKEGWSDEEDLVAVSEEEANVLRQEVFLLQKSIHTKLGTLRKQISAPGLEETLSGGGAAEPQEGLVDVEVSGISQPSVSSVAVQCHPSQEEALLEALRHALNDVWLAVQDEGGWSGEEDPLSRLNAIRVKAMQWRNEASKLEETETQWQQTQSRLLNALLQSLSAVDVSPLRSLDVSMSNQQEQQVMERLAEHLENVHETHRLVREMHSLLLTEMEKLSMSVKSDLRLDTTDTSIMSLSRNVDQLQRVQDIFFRKVRDLHSHQQDELSLLKETVERLESTLEAAQVERDDTEALLENVRTELNISKSKCEEMRHIQQENEKLQQTLAELIQKHDEDTRTVSKSDFSQQFSGEDSPKKIDLVSEAAQESRSDFSHQFSNDTVSVEHSDFQQQFSHEANAENEQREQRLAEEVEALRNEKNDLQLRFQTQWEKIVGDLQAKHQESYMYYQQLQQMSEHNSQVQAELTSTKEQLKESDIWKQHVTTLLDLDDRSSIQLSPEALASLVTSAKRDWKQLKMDIGRYVENEKKLVAELDRLREHLVEMEETCTREALAAEQREDRLRRQLLAAEEANSKYSSSTAVQHELYVTQLEELKDEKVTAWQRIEEQEATIQFLTHEVTTTQEQLNKLQAVLITSEAEKEASIHSETERLHREVAHVKEEYAELEKRNAELQTQISSQQQVSDAARRLTTQMLRAEEDNNRLKNIIEQRDNHIQQLIHELNQQKQTLDAKIDKVLAKNLIIGYFHAPANKRGDALRVVGSFLGFSDADFQTVGVDVSGRSGWFSGWMKRDPALERISENPTGQSTSFSQQFIKFLELESNPTPSLRLATDNLLLSPPSSGNSSMQSSTAPGRQRMSTSFSGSTTSSSQPFSRYPPPPPPPPTSSANPLLAGLGSSSSSGTAQNL